MLRALTPTIEALQGGFALMPALIFAGLVPALLIVGLQSALGAWRSARVLQLVASAPLVGAGSTAHAGPVKLRGEAQSANPQDTEPVIWQHNTRSWGGGSRSSATKAVPFILRTSDGDVLVDPKRAIVVPSRSHQDHALFDRDRYTVDKGILRGDAMIAIGRLHAASATTNIVNARRLGPSMGVLLVAGVPEREVSVLYGLWLAVQVPLSVVCLTLALWGGRIHLSTYPTGPNGRLANVFEALRRFPLTNAPGFEIQMEQEARNKS